MSNVNVIRAWKDEAYRASLSKEELALLPMNPAGVVEYNDSIALGAANRDWPTAECCDTGSSFVGLGMVAG